MSILAQADLATAVSAAMTGRGRGPADMSETKVSSIVLPLTFIDGRVLPIDRRVHAAELSSEFSTQAAFGCLGDRTS